MTHVIAIAHTICLINKSFSKEKPRKKVMKNGDSRRTLCFKSHCWLYNNQPNWMYCSCCCLHEIIHTVLDLVEKHMACGLKISVLSMLFCMHKTESIDPCFEKKLFYILFSSTHFIFPFFLIHSYFINLQRNKQQQKNCATKAFISTTTCKQEKTNVSALIQI